MTAYVQSNFIGEVSIEFFQFNNINQKLRQLVNMFADISGFLFILIV